MAGVMHGDLESQDWPVKVKWVDNFQFLGRDEEGHALVMDIPPQSGGEGSGFSPTKLLLMSLAGCTAMDIINIMRKQRQNIESLEVYSNGDQEILEYPHYFTEIKLKYVMKGKNLSRDLVEKAIRLSDEKYCSVGATLKGRAKILTTYEILNTEEK